MVCTIPQRRRIRSPIAVHLDQVIGGSFASNTIATMAYDYQFEPVWTFMTGSVGHTLLTGLEAIHQTTYTQRQTADLSNIANVFAPVPPEANGLVPNPFSAIHRIPATTTGCKRPI